ncbi:hypothetical protein M5K25_005067 [Dendrobium thyrsiflorum]|uniref:Uncharacterized protein n=1 Tax=Dendrobium thyrsiflorum TaxID=117978 RepID=A0ABD0VN83_DENTH
MDLPCWRSSTGAPSSIATSRSSSSANATPTPWDILTVIANGEAVMSGLKQVMICGQLWSLGFRPCSLTRRETEENGDNLKAKSYLG